MNRFILTGLILAVTMGSQASQAQTSMALEQACYSDIDLTEYVVQLIGNGASNTSIVTSDEAAQIVSVLNEDENTNLSVAGKLSAILTACSEGRILQTKFSHVTDQQ